MRLLKFHFWPPEAKAKAVEILESETTGLFTEQFRKEAKQTQERYTQYPKEKTQPWEKDWSLAEKKSSIGSQKNKVSRRKDSWRSLTSQKCNWAPIPSWFAWESRPGNLPRELAWQRSLFWLNYIPVSFPHFPTLVFFISQIKYLHLHPCFRVGF